MKSGPTIWVLSAIVANTYRSETVIDLRWSDTSEEKK
jgi:hypothetical protein